MTAIDYDATRESLYHPGKADNFFQLSTTKTANEDNLCAEMSRLAYVTEQERLISYLDRAGFDLHWSMGYEANGTQLFIAKTKPNSQDPPLIVVAFRGTEPDDLADLAADANLLKTPWLDVSGMTLGEVHKGFADALLDDPSNGNILMQLCSQLNKLEDAPRILLTGHSLGAALATLTAGYLNQSSLAEKIHLYTFGSPLVGDSAFAKQMNEVRHDRYVNCCDLVTRIPPESLGYKHSGTRHYINRNGRIINAITKPGMAADRQKASLAYLKDYSFRVGSVWLRKFADHSPINYSLSIKDLYTTDTEAIAEEYPYIHARRNQSIPNTSDNDEPQNLVGLAISGGGIRSATFGLGVIEALKEKGLLQKIDYLSTVSGGGYIGSWLTANCHRRGNDWLKRPSNNEDSAEWHESVAYLRRYSNYLSPNLSLLSADTWSMGTIWLRNTILVQLMVIMAIAWVLLLPRFFWKSINLKSLTEFATNMNIDSDILSYFLCFLPLLAFAGLSYWIAGNLKQLKKDSENKKSESNSLLSRIPRYISAQKTVQQFVILSMLVSLGVSAILWDIAAKGLSYQDCIFKLLPGHSSLPVNYPLFMFLLLGYGAFVLFSFCSSRNNLSFKNFVITLPATIVFSLLIAAILYTLGNWKGFATTGGGLLAFTWAPPMVLCAYSLAITLLIGVQGNCSYESVREWWSRFAAWLAIYGFAWMFVVTIAFYSSMWSAILYYEGSWKTLGTGWIGTTLAGLFAGKSADTSGITNNGITVKLKEVVAKAAPFVFIIGLVIAISLALHLAISMISSDNLALSQASLLGNTVQDSKQISLRLNTKPDLENIAVLPECTDSSSPNCEKKWAIQAQANYTIKDAKFDLSNHQVDSPISSSNYPAHWQLIAKANDFVVGTIWFLCFLCVVLLSCRLDINEFSLNAFYRNRLARCYLGSTRKPKERNPHPFTGFDDDDDLPLAKLINYEKPPAGPFHIINCALNLGGSTDLSLHTRHSAIFTLTPLHCGSWYVPKKPNSEPENKMSNNAALQVGYFPTNAFGGAENQPSLGQAISISEAAASPNMGYHTSKSVAFLMTLFDARLGWWFPNPSKSDCTKPSPSMSMRYLLRELFGLANEKSEFSAISDGGHFENLAAYELVKRRCKVIVISDGECDPKHQFAGLANLIRICNVDLGATIDIDVRSIQPQSESGWSHDRCALGKIYYGKFDPDSAPDGWLIYIKAAMNGQEDTAVMQYKATHANFPHETTGDQFYGEDQFESYRSLGRDITDKLFGKVINKEGQLSDNIKIAQGLPIDGNTSHKDYIPLIAKELHKIFSPTLPDQSQFTLNSDRLMKIWNLLSKSKNLGALDNELFTSWDGKNPDRSIFYLCSEMIQLMEKVYLDLNLENTWEHEDNKGWQALFKQWAKSSQLNATWELTKLTHGERFLSFWERHLA